MSEFDARVDLRSIGMEFIASEAPEERELARLFGASLLTAGGEEDQDTAGERFGVDSETVTRVAFFLLALVANEALDAGKKVTYGLVLDYLVKNRKRLQKAETKLHGRCTVLPKLEAFVRSRAK